MKHWRCPSPHPLCGRCGRLLGQNDPVLELQIPGVIQSRVRCQDCAGEPVNWTQIQGPSSAAIGSRTEVMQRLREIVPASFDPRMAAANDREGE